MDIIESTTAASLDGIPHGFLGRRGGVSTGIHGGLNVGLGSEDNREAVLENRRRAGAHVLPGASLVTVHQVHSADVVIATQAWPDDARPKVDAIVTDRPGLLFADAQAGVIGAAHAGWKGAIGGVTDSVIAAMEQLGAERSRIQAAIGPCIARASYEVDDGFVKRFETEDPANERFFTPGRVGHHQFDLEGYIAARLALAGIGRVEALGLDTYAAPVRFFSFRRATHRGEPDYGRQISLIGLPV
jgi:polyphenol oxidase